MSDTQSAVEKDEGQQPALVAEEPAREPMSRKLLREATIGAASKPQHEMVDVEGVGRFEVRSLSYKERKQVHKAAAKTTTSKSGDLDIDFDQSTYELQLLIRSTYVPGTEERVFGPADIDSLQNQHIGPGHWMQKLITAASKMNTAGN